MVIIIGVAFVLAVTLMIRLDAAPIENCVAPLIAETARWASVQLSALDAGDDKDTFSGERLSP